MTSNEGAVPRTLLGLVQCRSFSGEEAGAVTWLVERMHALGFTRAYADGAGNAVGMMGTDGPQVMLLGHIDTAAGEVPVHVEDGALYGRGTVDAKGALAAFVDAVASVGPTSGRRFVVIGAVGEEADSRGAQHVAAEYSPECVVIGEPSGWQRVTLGYRGYALFEYQVCRAVSHTASGAQSACEAAVAFWNRLTAECSAFNSGRERLFDQLSPALRGMRSNSDGLEECAVLRVSARLPEGLSAQEWGALLDSLRAGGEVRALCQTLPAWRAEKNAPLVRAFLGAIRSLGGAPGFVLKTGTSDMNVVGPAWGCPLLAYGPGDSRLDHTPDEHLLLDEYRRSVDVLAAALRAI